MFIDILTRCIGSREGCCSYLWCVQSHSGSEVAVKVGTGSAELQGRKQIDCDIKELLCDCWPHIVRDLRLYNMYTIVVSRPEFAARMMFPFEFG